jgi:hypothetical protein
MPYRLTYKFNISWVGAGLNDMAQAGPNAQTLGLVNVSGGQNLGGTGTGGALATADITALTNAAAADMSAQLNANIGVPQGWISGQG